MRSTSLYKQLRDLRKGDGLTPQRLNGAPAVMAALGVETGEAGVEALKAKIEQLPRTLSRDAMANALNLARTGRPKITNRREEFALGKGHVKTIEGWENDAFEELARALRPLLPAHQPDHLTEVRVQGSVLSSLAVWQVTTTKTYRRPNGETYAHATTVGQRPDSPGYLRSVVYTLDWNETPDDLLLSVTWSQQRPEHYWWWVFDSMAHYSCKNFRTGKHEHPQEPLSDNIWLQFPNPSPGMVYEITW